MGVRYLLISLLLVRAMLGGPCATGSGAPSCAATCGAADACCCSIEHCPLHDRLRCYLCCAFEGRVPAIEPARPAGDGRLESPPLARLAHTPPWVFEHHDTAPPGHAPQVCGPPPWGRRLRPIVCVWTI